MAEYLLNALGLYLFIGIGVALYALVNQARDRDAKTVDGPLNYSDVVVLMMFFTWMWFPLLVWGSNTDDGPWRG